MLTRARPRNAPVPDIRRFRSHECSDYASEAISVLLDEQRCLVHGPLTRIATESQ